LQQATTLLYFHVHFVEGKLLRNNHRAETREQDQDLEVHDQLKNSDYNVNSRPRRDRTTTNEGLLLPVAGKGKHRGEYVPGSMSCHTEGPKCSRFAYRTLDSNRRCQLIMSYSRPWTE